MLTDEKRNTPALDCPEKTVPDAVRSGCSETMSLTHIQRLVRLLDHGDIAEIELNRAKEGLRLVLRKLKASEGAAQAQLAQYTGTDKQAIPGDGPDQPAPAAKLSYLAAPIVGIFHPWLTPRGNVLVTAGDLVKADQVVGTIEALNILNEVRTSVAGRVTEISVQDGQPVEYGQPLLTIDSSPRV